MPRKIKTFGALNHQSIKNTFLVGLDIREILSHAAFGRKHLAKPTSKSDPSNLVLDVGDNYVLDS